MDYLFGYGSLLNQYSRQHHSNIQTAVSSATLSGWARGWCATYLDEGATYAGAMPNSGASLDGVLIPTRINAGISERERGYRFTRLDSQQITVNTPHQLTLAEQDSIWICETLDAQKPNVLNPLPQSYVDTCISGCIETHGIDGATRFIQQTNGWDCVWVNDRHYQSKPIYPRFSPLPESDIALIDTLLDQQGVLQYRTNESVS